MAEDIFPSDAAEEAEVALETEAAADDGIRFLNEYRYENDLITDFARLQADPARKTLMLVFALAFIAGGIWLLVAGGDWAWLGIICVLVGVFLIWYRKNLHHILAKQYIDAVEGDTEMGGRYRRVAANDGGLMVWGGSGRSKFFSYEKLDRVLDGERIFVAMFGEHGVTVPKDTFVRGEAEEFRRFLKERAGK